MSDDQMAGTQEVQEVRELFCALVNILPRDERRRAIIDSVTRLIQFLALPTDADGTIAELNDIMKYFSLLVSQLEALADKNKDFATVAKSAELAMVEYRVLCSRATTHRNLEGEEDSRDISTTSLCRKTSESALSGKKVHASSDLPCTSGKMSATPEAFEMLVSPPTTTTKLLRKRTGDVPFSTGEGRRTYKRKKTKVGLEDFMAGLTPEQQSSLKQAVDINQGEQNPNSSEEKEVSGETDTE